MVVTRNRQVLLGRLEVLADGHDVHIDAAQIVQHRQNFVPLLAQPDHQTALGERLRVKLLRHAQDVEAALVLGLRPHPAREPRHGLGVVIEDLRMRVHHQPERLTIALEVGDQHLDGAAGLSGPNLPDRVRKDVRAAVGLVVAVDAGQHDVTQLHLRHRVGHAARLVLIQRQRLARLHVAELARAGADVAHQQEGRDAAAPALAQVGAERLLADGVQRLAAHQRLQLPVLFVLVQLDAQPLRLAAGCGLLVVQPRAAHRRRGLGFEGNRVNRDVRLHHSSLRLPKLLRASAVDGHRALDQPSPAASF